MHGTQFTKIDSSNKKMRHWTISFVFNNINLILSRSNVIDHVTYVVRRQLPQEKNKRLKNRFKLW